MKLSIVVFAVILTAAVQGTRYENDCILVDIEGSVTITAKEDGAASGQSKTLQLEPVSAGAVNGSCSNSSLVSLAVSFNESVEWKVYFSLGEDKMVTMDQLLSFNPSVVFNSSFANEPISLTDKGNLTLSPENQAYECAAEQTIAFEPNESENVTYTVTQTIRNFKVQAFGVVNGNYSKDVVDCEADKNSTTSTPAPVTTEPPTTAPPAPTTPKPTPPPVTPRAPETFVVNDDKGVACFRLEAGLQFYVEYNTTNNTMEYSAAIPITNAEVNGTCGNDTATMVISGKDFTLELTETRTADSVSSAIVLNVTLNADNFPDAQDANKTVSFKASSAAFQQSQTDTFYVCNTQQQVTFTGASGTVLFADQVKLQAFDLNNGSFTGAGEECSIDPTPAPSTPAPTPSDNTYAVKDGNKTCIVLKGDISISNITYTKKDKSVATADPINIPAYNGTSGEVKVSGNCSLTNTSQQLVITFNSNWTLALTFTSGDKVTAMLGAGQDEYSLSNIDFTYDLRPEYFPDAATPGAPRTSSANVTDDQWKGQVGGGSFKCDAKVTESLSDGVLLDTSNLQYKAFNTDNSTDFNTDNVSECPADDESNSIVPIAVGAALAGLVVIVLIAYLIGRRRSRRQGYESV